MTAPKVIWAWPWEVSPDMGQWEAKPSIVGEGIRYIRADDTELVALVDVIKSPVGQFLSTKDKLAQIRAALAAYEALQ